MKKALYLGMALVAMLSSIKAQAYADCWTSYFNPNSYATVYDDEGLRYIGGLATGVTCGCSVNTSTIWISGAGKKGSTGAVLAASMAGRQVRFLLHEENSDGYCRGSIVEVKAN